MENTKETLKTVETIMDYSKICKTPLTWSQSFTLLLNHELVKAQELRRKIKQNSITAQTEPITIIVSDT
jgi:hypothetical protein